MPVEIRQLIIQTKVESPPEPPSGKEQEQEEDDCLSEQPDRAELLTQVMDNIKRQKER